MKQFTQSTIVQPLARFRCKRLLPTNGEFVVPVGQEVSPVHVLARTPLVAEFHVLPASEQLGVAPPELVEFLQVSVGETVGQGVTLAEKKGLLGRQKRALSPVDGTLVQIHNGRLIISQTSDWLELRAMVRGRVASHIGQRGVVLEVTGSLIQGIWACGDAAFGPLKVVGQSGQEPLRAEQIDAAADHILVAGHVNQSTLLLNAENSGVRGIIAGSMPADLCRLAPELSFPIVLTDGVGEYAMADPIFQLLLAANGQEASLVGPLTLLPGERPRIGERPEIIIPRPAEPGVDTPPLGRPLNVGQLVRIVRSPYHGQVGSVVRFYNHLRPTAVGMKAPGADVELADGRQVFVPVVNLDAII